MIFVRLRKPFIRLMRNSLERAKSKNAFSLIELMLSLVILIILLTGLLYTYVVCFKLNDSSRSLTLVNSALQAQLELIRETPFVNLTSTWDGENFDLAGFSANDAVGFIDIYDTVYDDDLKYMRLVACWREGSNRVIGEDVNLDGELDQDEDLDDDGIVDSPAELVTLISYID